MIVLYMFCAPCMSCRGLQNPGSFVFYILHGCILYFLLYFLTAVEVNWHQQYRGQLQYNVTELRYSMLL